MVRVAAGNSAPGIDQHVRRLMIISVHVPKTAGTTFMHYLQKSFPGGVLGDYGEDTQVSYLFDSCFDDLAGANKPGQSQLSLVSEGILKCRRAVVEKGIQVIHGHFGITKYLGVFPDATYVVWLRHPLERTLSEYYHHKRFADSPYWAIYDRELTFEQWMAIDWHVNLQHRLTNGDLSKFHFVGISEEFDESLSEFSRLVGVAENGADLHISPVNINPEKEIHRNYEVGNETRERFIELNQLDMALYGDAVDRFERDRNRSR